MEPTRWTRLQELFGQALALPQAQRAAFVAQACAGDTALAAELNALLASDAAPDAVPEALARAAAQALRADRRGWVGQQLGAWRIDSHLADGGMGAVYLASRADGQYEQQAALKLLNPGLITPAAQERLSRERQILARLTHPHIARLLDGGSTPEGLPYLVMEYVDGEPIDAWCHARGLATAARLRLFVQVCAAVDHAHRNFVVHRDLKPSNILVNTEGVPKLLDFGIAKMLEGDGAAGLTRSGERPLTPSHASPEQVAGGAISTATDVYALGVLLYDLLTGELPHQAHTGSPAALARAIVESDPVRPSDAVASTGSSSRRLAQLQQRGEQLTPQRLARELQGDLDNIVLMALRKEPERRYDSARALAEDIERHLAHRPVRARPDTLPYRSAKFLRRHPVAVPVSALALLLALAGTAAFTWRLSDERDRALAAEGQARQSAQRARQAAEFTASILGNTGANEGAAREVSVQDLLATAARRVKDELSASPQVATRMRTALGRAFHTWGSYEDAMRELEPALAEARGRGEAGAREQAEILSLLGTVTHDLGQLEISLDWTRQAQALWRRVGTPAEQANALRDLALALNGLRRRSEAEPVFRAALAQMRLAHPGDHDDTAWLLNNLGWCLHAMGRLDEAGPVYEEALAMQRRMGSALVEISQTQSNVGGLYYDRGDLGAAQREWTESLANFESVYGAGGHAAVARGQNLLALVALDRGNTEEGLRLTKLALDSNLHLLGEKHRWSAITMQSHGVALLQAGRLDEARRWLERSLTVRRQVLPPGHADHVGSHNGLARLALARGQRGAAEREYRQALRIIEGLATPDRVPRGRVELGLGHVIALQGRREEGLAMAQQGLQHLRERYPADHWRRQQAEVSLALRPFVAQVTPQAEAAARRALDELRLQLGPRAPAVLALQAQLALPPA